MNSRSNSASQVEKSPNLLFVLSDQHAYDLCGFNGHDQVQTPHLDGFSRDGMVVDNHFTICPLCTPARGALLSGRHPLHNDAFDNCIRMRPGCGQYFAEVLKSNGYRTGWIGKWHLYGGYWYQPVPPGEFRYGFDDCFLTNNCDLNYTPENAYYFDQDSNQRILFREWEQFGQTRQAMRFLDDVDDAAPWCLFLSLHPPHDHRSGAPEDYYSYLAPSEYLDRYDFEGVRVRSGTPETEINRRMMHGYMSLISTVDDCFGMLLDKLRKRGMAEDTIVVYTSDHGDMVKQQDGIRFVKSRPEAQSSQVPFVIRWPGRVPANQRSNVMLGTLDLMPTLLSMMGVEIPESCQGVDLSMTLLGENGVVAKSLPQYMQSITHWRGVVTENWIYSVNPFENKGVERSHSVNVLYDRREDPHCLANRFRDTALSGIREELHRLTMDWMDYYEDAFIPYAVMLDTVIDPVDLRGMPYVNFLQPESTGVPVRRPLEFVRDWREKYGMEPV